jgi:transcription elongation GreA/GreB family factor
LAAKKISWKSPVGAGLLKARKGDELEIETPRGPMYFTVIDYHYDD